MGQHCFTKGDKNLFGIRNACIYFSYMSFVKVPSIQYKHKTVLFDSIRSMPDNNNNNDNTTLSYGLFANDNTHFVCVVLWKMGILLGQYSHLLSMDILSFTYKYIYL